MDGEGDFLEQVSIHAPLARSNKTHDVFRVFKLFQYMLLLRGATRADAGNCFNFFVSIHAPLARSNSSNRSRMLSESPFQYMLLLRGATGLRG